MYICVYVYMCICMYVYVYVCIYMYLYICICIYRCDTIWKFIIAAGYLKFAVRRIFRLKFEAVTVVEGKKCTMKSRVILIFCKYY